MSDPNPFEEIEALEKGMQGTEEAAPVVTEVTARDTVLDVPLSKIFPWDVCQAVRTAPDPEALTTLRENIREHGIQNPLWVTPAEGGCFLLIAGYRRLAAAQALGLQTVPCVQRMVQDPDRARLLAMVENSARDDLSEADNFRNIQWMVNKFQDRLIHKAGTGGRADEGKINVVALAAMLGKSYFWTRLRVKTMELFKPAELERVATKISSDASADVAGASRMTWSKVLYAALDPNAAQYRDAILEMVDGQRPPEATDGEGAGETVETPLTKEVYVPVKFDLLAGNGISLRLGQKPGKTVETLLLRVGIEDKFRLGKRGFQAGETGDKKLSEFLRYLGEKFLKLATIGEGEATPEEQQMRLGLREALDSSVAKLAQKIGAAPNENE